MKNVSSDLATFLSTVRNCTACDLYELTLHDGNKYYYTNADIDLTYNGNVYHHDKVLLKREQIKLHSEVVVDTLTVTASASKNDKIAGVQFLKAGHDGTFDRAFLRLKRCFFRNTSVVGVFSLFGGNVEIKQGGGIRLQLFVKAKTQGLNMSFPIRRYFPNGMYSETSDGKVISSTETDKTTLIAPFIPRKEVLL